MILGHPINLVHVGKFDLLRLYYKIADISWKIEHSNKNTVV